MNVLLLILAVFAPLSLLTIGSPWAILPEIHRVTVANAWMTEQQFVDVFAIVQASPGPNLIFFAAIGWFAGGLPGAIVALLAIVGLPCVVTYAIGRTWVRFSAHERSIAVQRAFAPLAVGFLFASAMTLTTAAVGDTPWRYGLTAISAILAYSGRVHLLVILVAATALGLGAGLWPF